MWDYASTQKLKGHQRLDVNERTATCIRELIRRTLDVDWWKRPTAGDVVQLLDSLTNPDASGSVFYINEDESESDSSSSSVPLEQIINSRSLTPVPQVVIQEEPEITFGYVPTPQVNPFPSTGAGSISISMLMHSA